VPAFSAEMATTRKRVNEVTGLAAASVWMFFVESIGSVSARYLIAQS